MNGFTENECLPNLKLKFKISENLRKPLTQKYKKTHWLWKGFLCLHTGAAHKKKKKENVWFCSGGFSYATDIALIASRLMLYRFFMWNLTWDSLVKQWIFLYSSMYTGTHLKNLTSWIHHHANTLYFFSCVYLKNVDMLSLLPTHFALL